jgi:hypothetical protein
MMQCIMPFETEKMADRDKGTTLPANAAFSHHTTARIYRRHKKALTSQGFLQNGGERGRLSIIQRGATDHNHTQYLY